MKPKIFFIVYNIFGIGGTVRTTALLANELSKREYKIEIISLANSEGKPSFYVDSKITLNVIKRRDVGFKDFIRNNLLRVTKSRIFDKDEDLYKNISAFIDQELEKKLDQIKEGIVIGTIPSLNRLIAHKFKKQKNVLTIGQEHKGFIDHSKRIRELIIKNYIDLDFLTILTEKNKSNYTIINSNVHVIGNASLNIPYKALLSSKKIIVLSRLVKQKGIELLIDALHEENFFHRNPGYVLEIFGEGKLENKLNKKINSLNFSDKILLKGAVSNIYPYLLDSELIVVPSIYEPFGMVVIEAMSCGLPVVSFKTEGPSEIIKDNGILVDIENKKELIKAIETVIRDEKLKTKMGERSKALFIEKYSSEKLTDYWEINILSNYEERVSYKEKSIKMNLLGQ